MKTIRLAFILTIVALKTFAQDFEVPTDYKLEEAQDFDHYEKDILSCVNWLNSTPLNKETEKRKAANAFLFKWIAGSSKIHIELKQEIITFMDDGELLIIFMGAWTKYSIESNDFNNKLNGTIAGVESVIDFYSKNKGAISKNKAVDKYIKMKEKGTLKDYLEKNA
jgi:hypothetical protein